MQMLIITEMQLFGPHGTGLEVPNVKVRTAGICIYLPQLALTQHRWEEATGCKCTEALEGIICHLCER